MMRDQPESQYIYEAHEVAGREGKFFGYFSTFEKAKEAVETYHAPNMARKQYPANALIWREGDGWRGWRADWHSVDIQYYITPHQLDVIDSDAEDED